MEKDYYVGLDVGTDSVGAACTDEEYGLLRLKGRDAWAVRLFDEAEVAQERRMKRVARRRLRRRVWRLHLLRSIFAPHIEDELFFARLDNSPYALGDKDAAIKSGYVLFADPDYTDKQYHKQFPTIFHLRLALMRGDKKYDLRLYYLAIHHIVKYRGNFLHEGKSFGSTGDLAVLMRRLNAEIEAESSDDECDEGEIFSLDPALASRFERAYLDGRGIADRKKAAIELFGAADARAKAIVSAAVGATVALGDLYGDDTIARSEKIAFSAATDEKLVDLAAQMGDRYGLIEALKAVYDYFALKMILKGASSISEAMVGIYDKFHADLVRLKKFVRGNYPPQVYTQIFKSIGESDIEKANFARYIGYTKPQKRKRKVKKCTPEEFFDSLRKTLEREFVGADAAERDAIIGEIKEGRFLKKILHADSGVIPCQVNGYELEKIVDNLVRDYPAFGESDADGLTPAQKIQSLFTFRIPYYVGPLNVYGGSKNAWAKRKERGAVFPWNFDEKVDRAASGEEFIRRMTNSCTYLIGEPVLPASSPLYEKFNVLNIINKLTIREKPISAELKKRLFDELYSVDPRVTDRKIADFLVRKGYVEPAEASGITIGGRDKEVKHPSMATYIRLKAILGPVADERPEIAENIVLWHTLHTDKSIVEGLIRKNYGDVPAVMENMGALKGLGVKGFGKLSKKFLTGIYTADRETGVMRSVLDVMYDTNKNLNEVIYCDEYDFLSQIKEAAGADDGEVTYGDVEELPLSPKIRRGVWQALGMVAEYVAAAGKPPKKIFVEVTRAPDKKKERKESRKEKLRKLLSSEEDRELLRELEGFDDMRLREEKLWFYFMQRGRCAYSGEKIELGALGSDGYDIDHIVPQSLVKDDGFENKVLVKRSLNAKKSDVYPLPAGFVAPEARRMWEVWRSKGLIGPKKYGLLTRKEPLSEDDINGFIARQVVETGQTAKAVAQLLQKAYPESKIVYSKARNVSEFRDRYGITKCREVNDLHHARDAYLNIVVGNVYDVRFPSAAAYYRKRDDGAVGRYNLDALFERDLAGAWTKDESLKKVKETCRKTSMAVTRYTFTGGGAFYDETVRRKGDSGIRAPRKTVGPLADAEKYGGYTSIKTAYFAIVDSDGKKGKRMRTIEAIPVIVDYKACGDEKAVVEYLSRSGLKNPRLVVPKIRLQTLLKINGMPLYIAGITGKQLIFRNAVQWHTDERTERYIKAAGKLLEMKRSGSPDEGKEYYDMTTNRSGKVSLRIERESNVALYDEIIDKLAGKLYAIAPAQTFRRNLADGREKFVGLTVFKQVETLMECVKFMQCNALSANLSNIGGGGHCGILLLSKNITDMNVVIVHSSACGLDFREVKVH